MYAVSQPLYLLYNPGLAYPNPAGIIEANPILIPGAISIGPILAEKERKLVG